MWHGFEDPGWIGAYERIALDPGHEVAGVVAATGADVKRFREGDAVLVSFYIPCNSCRTVIVGGRPFVSG